MSTERVRVELGERSYDVFVGPGLVARTGALIAERLPGRKLAVVTDANVAALHLPALRAALDEAKIAATEIVVPAGESTKSFEWLQSVVE
jgi:3-dehydroquinate synthase